MKLSELLETVGDTATVVTRRHSMNRSVRWVHITDLPDPSPYLRGGEFILTNGLWYRDREDTVRFVDAVADAGAPAIGYPLSEGLAPPPELAEACDRRGVLLMLFPDIPFRDVAERVMTRLVEERQLARVQAGGIAKELGRRITAGEGATALCEILERESGARASLLFKDGRTVGSPLGGPDRVASVWEQMFATPMPRDSVLELSPPGRGRVTSAPVAHRPVEGRLDEVSAALVLDAPLSALGESIDTLCWIAANYLPRTGALEAAELRQRRCSEFLDAARSRPLGETELLVELRRLDPDSDWAAGGVRSLALLIAGAPQPVSPDALAGAIRTAMPGAAVLAGELDGRAAALVAVEDDLEVLAATVSDRLGVLAPSISLGAAEMKGPDAAYSRMAAQAGQALRIAEHSDDRRWATARQAGSYPLLLGDADPLVLESLLLTTVDPLTGYDEAHGTELVRTLRVFLDSCGSWQRAADELRLHVNSLRYRIGRIEQLTGRDLGRMSDRVDFFLALEARGDAPAARRDPFSTAP